MTRKIDKRACRKFALPELEFNLNEGVLHVESCPYIIRTAVRNIAGQRILMLYIYQREHILTGSINPRWVMFQSRDDFATLSLRENASATWQCSMLDSLDRIYRFDTKCAFYRQQDEARATRFCKCDHSVISALTHLQWSISRRKALERKRKKQRVIIERMKYVPALPRDLKGFVHREVMPQYIFYDYQRKGPERAVCTACRHEVSIAAAKHNASGTCPRCKKKITFKCRGRRGRVFDQETVQVLQKAKNGEMLLRIVKAYRTFTDADTPVYFSVYENARHFISLCSDGHCSTSPYYLASAYKDDLTPWKCGYRPHFLSWRDSFEGDTAGHLYFRNLAELLRNTPWQYSQLERFARIAATMDAIPYLNAYVQWPVIEYLVKAKLFRLVSDIVYGPYRGKVKLAKGQRLCMLPQNARSLFVADTVEKELLDSAEQDKARAVQMAERLELTPLLARHPYDLSGGEIQRLAVGKLLLREATVLLLDEPTKGLDAYAKAELAQLLQELCREGTSILIVTHDVEFAARYATGCALMFDGLLLSEGEPHDFFAGNRFYTTDANRIAAEHFPMDITCEEVIASCRSSLSAKEPEPPRG